MNLFSAAVNDALVNVSSGLMMADGTFLIGPLGFIILVSYLRALDILSVLRWFEEREVKYNYI